jgi:hypothetical protein
MGASAAQAGRVAPVERVREQGHGAEHHGWITSRGDFVIAFLLGVTVIGIGWGAYKAEVAANHGNHYFNRSSETLATAHKLELQGDQEVSADEALFLEYERDRAEGHIKAVAYLRRRLITPELWSAIRWWEQEPLSTRPPSPFVDANPNYRNSYYTQGRTRETQASHYLEKAHKAEERVLDYTIVSVLLTIGLFVLGISTQFITPRVKFGLVAVGAVVFIASVGRFIDFAVS